MTDHVKRFHPSLNLGEFYMVMHSVNMGKRMSYMFTTGVRRHTNSPKFDKYMEIPSTRAKEICQHGTSTETSVYWSGHLMTSTSVT